RGSPSLWRRSSFPPSSPSRSSRNLPELLVRICDLTIRVEAESAPFIAAAKKRYKAFLAKGAPDLRLTLTFTSKKLRPYRDEPRVVWDGRAGRIERHDLELEFAPGIGR